MLFEVKLFMNVKTVLRLLEKEQKEVWKLKYYQAYCVKSYGMCVWLYNYWF
jgi:hypothetical protein